jgi:hypothetical protein
MPDDDVVAVGQALGFLGGDLFFDFRGEENLEAGSELVCAFDFADGGAVFPGLGKAHAFRYGFCVVFGYGGLESGPPFAKGGIAVLTDRDTHQC